MHRDGIVCALYSMMDKKHVKSEAWRAITAVHVTERYEVEQAHD